MSQKQSFDAVIQPHASGGAFVDVPFDVEQVFGRKRVPILAHIEGVPYRGTLVRMGGDCHMLLIRKDIRERIGKQPGDRVHVTLEEDTSPREVAVPQELAQALAAEPAALAFFEGLAFTYRREYVEWITGAKRDATRVARVEKAVALLKAGRKEP